MPSNALDSKPACQKDLLYVLGIVYRLLHSRSAIFHPDRLRLGWLVLDELLLSENRFKDNTCHRPSLPALRGCLPISIRPNGMESQHQRHSLVLLHQDVVHWLQL